MAATNIFYRIPSQRGTRIATIRGAECTLHQFCNYIAESEGLDINDFIIASGTKIFRPQSCCLQTINLQNNSNVDILIPLLGGKGGFGSLLRAIGAQIEKTTNRDACRDLSGRRLRDIKREDELRKLIALQERLKEERKRRKKEKLDKLKKTIEESSSSKSIEELVAMFDDHAFNKRRLELSDIIEAAVDKGIINFRKRQQVVNIDLNSRLNEDPKNDASPAEELPAGNTSQEGHKKDRSSENVTISSTQKVICKTRKDQLWLGLDEDEEEVDAEGGGDEKEDTARL